MRVHHIIALLIVLLLPSNAWAKKGERSTVYGDFDFGFTTHKSQLLVSNETTQAIRYTVGLFAGDDKSISVALSSETVSTVFLLNNASMDLAFTDTYVRYHLWFLYVGAIIESATMTAVDTSGTTLFDLSSSGFGGNFGANIAFGRGAMFNFNVDFITTSQVIDIQESDVLVDPRFVIDLGLSFDVTRKMIDLIVGYRMNSYGITTDANYAEDLTTTYFGLGADLYF